MGKSTSVSSLLTFRVGQYRFCVDAVEAEAIVEAPEATPTDGRPDEVLKPSAASQEQIKNGHASNSSVGTPVNPSGKAANGPIISQDMYDDPTRIKKPLTTLRSSARNRIKPAHSGFGWHKLAAGILFLVAAGTTSLGFGPGTTHRWIAIQYYSKKTGGNIVVKELKRFVS